MRPSQDRLPLVEFRYIADTSALISLVSARPARVHVRYLTRMVQDGRLRLPESVAREIKRREDKLRDWVNRHSPDCLQRATDDNIRELSRICRQHGTYLGEKATAADPIVVCMGGYYGSSGWTVLTDDSGIQAVCLIEGIAYVTSAAFRRIEGL